MGVEKYLKTLFILLVLVAIIFQQVEGRRTILKGRRTLTRTYLRDSPIAAWGIVLLVALGQIIIGVILFFVLKRFILDPPITGSYTPANTEDA